MSESFKYDVFISHSSKDKPAARALAQRLKHDGLRVCLGEEGMKQSRTLLLVMSRALFESDWVKLESQTLMFRDPTNSHRRFIPLLIGECTIPDTIAQFSYIDWQEKSDDAYKKALAACRPKKETVKGLVVKEAMVLKAHSAGVSCVALLPDGKRGVSGSWDNTLKIWDFESGHCLATLKGHTDIITCLTITPDGKNIISGSTDTTLRMWDIESGKCLATLEGGEYYIYGVAVTSDGKKAISVSRGMFKIWDMEIKNEIVSDKVAFGSNWPSGLLIINDGKNVIVNRGNYIEVLALESFQGLAKFEGHAKGVFCMGVTIDGKRVVSGSEDKTLKVWDLETSVCLATFEGHTNTVYCVAVTPDGKKVVSGSEDTTLKLWDLESGECLATFEGHNGSIRGVAATPDGKRVVSGSKDGALRIWAMPEFEEDITPEFSPRYTNAKVVLVGESGVGKTGLALRLAEDHWKETGSTHGMEVRQLELPGGEESTMDREVWLWDFAGQPDYRLIHQLYMDETALALMVIDPQRDNPFESLGHWEKALGGAVKHDPAKLLVAGRCDRGGHTVSRAKLEQYCKEHDYSGFLDTAAKTGDGCEKLKELIAHHIPWNCLPWTATSRLFKTLKDSIIRIKEEDIVLCRVSELRQRLQLELNESIDEKDLRAVVGLLAGQGIVQKLDFGDFVLLQPEQINNYASAVVRCVRENTDEIGCIPERDVLEAQFDFKDMKRLNEADEKILLRAMLQTFIDRSLCLREETPGGAQLVFPSYFKLDRPEIPEHPNVFVTYGFAGMAEEIYTTLVVRLHHTHDFDKEQLWKDAADFKSLGKKRVGLQMTKKTGDTAEIKVYFESDVPVDTQVSFIKYIHEHLQKRGKDVTRVRMYVCPHCDTPLENRKAIRKRLELGKKDIICGMCEKRVPLIDLIEEKFASDEFWRKVREMDAKAQINIDNESRELILVGHAFSTAGEAGQIFRPVTNSDWGLDGEIEFKNDKGEASGERVYLQLKSGDSYLYKRNDGEEVFYIKNPRHAEYWQAHKYPVMLVIRTSDGEIRWMNVTEYLKNYFKKDKKQAKQIVFKGESFTALNVARMRDRVV